MTKTSVTDLTGEQRALIAEGNASPELVVALADAIRYLAHVRAREAAQRAANDTAPPSAVASGDRR